MWRNQFRHLPISFRIPARSNRFFRAEARPQLSLALSAPLRSHQSSKLYPKEACRWIYRRQMARTSSTTRQSNLGQFSFLWGQNHNWRSWTLLNLGAWHQGSKRSLFTSSTRFSSNNSCHYLIRLPSSKQSRSTHSPNKAEVTRVALRNQMQLERFLAPLQTTIAKSFQRLIMIAYSTLQIQLSSNHKLQESRPRVKASPLCTRTCPL